MRKVTIRLADTSSAHYKVDLPDFFQDLEVQGIDLSRPFTMQVDTFLGVIEAEQAPVAAPLAICR
jgi:hypothetical protein